ncbi:16S rRNA (cytosine(1402)-N(4))-methyltransferase [Candidatus Berkelbacteria bacterium]|nr:16S rRNA (cytosine(1402)-N(4))-methyltransferase [Candidatus Berkelbacteria bacterium]
MPDLQHIPVLVDETIEQLALAPGDTVIDATLGLGGHAAAILEVIGPEGRLLGIERTEDGLEQARHNLDQFGQQADLVCDDFRRLDAIARAAGFERVAGVLFDLGLASWQIDTGYRGLSFQVEAPLDLVVTTFTPQDRTDQEEDPSTWSPTILSGRAGDAALARTVRTWRFRPARDFLARATEEEISNVLRSLGGVRSADRLAEQIVAARSRTPITTTGELVRVIGSESPGLLAPVFQALRILVNDEYGALVAGLRAGWELLVPGGHLVVITFQGTEDRITKAELRSLLGSNDLISLKPSAEEINANPRSRSATLRSIQKPAS